MLNRLLTSPRTADLALLACGVAVLVMMFIALGNTEVPQ
jgi:hypothetical protein